MLKSISGRLALELINNPKDAREIIGLALTRLLLHEDGDLKTGVLIPVDSHIDLFADHKRVADDSSIRLQRSDLILAHAKNNKLCLRLIEVKYRSNVGGIGEDMILKEAIVQKNANTHKVFEPRFIPRPEKDRLDRELQNKEFANLVHFYLERSRRHGLLEDSEVGAVALQERSAASKKDSLKLPSRRPVILFTPRGSARHLKSIKTTKFSLSDASEF